MEFQLFAPQNKAASLMGCFSNGQEIPMQKDESGYFQTQIDLADGIYQSKFRVRSNTESTPKIRLVYEV
ncbi:hypothetical protein PCC9214_00589 [Planktothrix tepida]|uniref:Glycoside hydrolase family 13 N-terminal domain-containing protein n=2 Tax=Planktothrix TaxID=54304 RepID=A0A1J1LFB7_9CYAN|nr:MULTISPECIES: glycogen-binding domain-containing protein [Planktothrix]CAD5919868.1 hypothetical protein PCC9214_00589 [Planktothrix tepida]CAD5983657.1 hypothetical protein NO713_05201 [Planktothrix pseudagardhii]CUR30878.1 hypothetical protein PL9214290469 [Planktothrix tepida PCC 9214]